MPSVEIEQEITARYAQGERTGDLAAEFGLRKPYISKIVRRNGGEVRGMGVNRLAVEQEAELVRLYADGLPLKQLRRQFGVHPQSIHRIVHRHGVAVRPQRRPHRQFTGAEIAEMTRLWTEDGLSQTAIAQRMDTAQVTVSRVLRAAGIEPVARHPRPRGERHGSWKGGRVTTASGYVYVAVDPDDPFASMRTREGYVLEHRLVVARALGRPLKRSESVHHINGDKVDNRLENLQLRNGQHGKGIVLRCASCGSHDIVEQEL